MLDQAIGKVAWGKKGVKEKVGELDAEIWNGTAKEGKLQVEAIYADVPGDKTVGIYWFDTQSPRRSSRRKST